MMKERVKELWKICFNDSEEFMELYFRLRYKTERNVAIESGEEVISALQMLPYPMTFAGETVQTSYISGACTHPDFRNRGVMRELLSQAFTRMLRSGVHFSTLIPAEPSLFDYYARMGYAPVFDYNTKEIDLPELLPSEGIRVERVTEYQEAVYMFLNRKLSERPCCIQHTKEDFGVILEDLAISSGDLFVARQDEAVTGVAIAYRRENEMVVNELCTEDKSVEQALMHAIGRYADCRRLVRLLPPVSGETSYPLGMARIIQAKEVLQLYAAAFPSDEMQIELSDRQLSANNGYYYLYKGKCMFSDERLPGAHQQMTIGELAARIFRPFKPYMSLMMD